MRKLPMSTSGHQLQDFSDTTIRRFLLAQLSTSRRLTFESALFSDPRLEQRLRLAEIGLTDAYAADRLRANERVAFRQKFLVTSDRLKKLEVSTALQKSFAPDFVSQPLRSLNQVFTWQRLAWRIAFVIIALVVVFAGALVIRREPQLVKRMIPKRLRPAVAPPPTPQPAHHSTNSSESRDHREQSPAFPAHEAAPHTITLRASVAAENAPVISLAQNGPSVVRLQLKLERQRSATFGIVVTTSSGEVVHDVPEIRVESADHIDFDVQTERLRPGDYHVTLTRIDDEHATRAIYYFRLQ